MKKEIMEYLKSVTPAELLDQYLTAMTDKEEDLDKYLPSGMAKEIEIMIQSAMDKINYPKFKSGGSIKGSLEN